MIEQLIAKLEADAERFEGHILGGGLKDYTEYKVNCMRVKTIRDLISTIRDAQHIEDEAD